MNPQKSVIQILGSGDSPQNTKAILMVFWGNLCKANTMFFSTASFINKCTEVHSTSTKGKCAESHLQKISKEHLLNCPSNSSHNTRMGGWGEGNNTVITSMTMTFKCLTSNLFSAVKIKQQVISFTMSHCAPGVQ